MSRSCVPKYIKRGEGKVTSSTFKKGEECQQAMNFHKRDARKPRPAQNKGRGMGIHMAKDNKRK
ncbi:MAG: hypothetical protein E3J56_01140 [Candidatus Aminicenantes bacterium]|nr:MAG: hypothetical protein E3J56_01140 [Candidatus Aminicenantes bacterium]